MKVLIVSPHMDDEVLSTASFLSDKSNNTTIFYHSSTHPHFDRSVMLTENKALTDYLGCNVIISEMIDVSDKLDTIPIRDLVNEFEKILYDNHYDMMLIANPSYNQDHRQLYEAALTAVRPHDRIPFVKKVLVYEEPETFGTLRNVNKFSPTYFKPVDIEEKIKLYHFYKSQVRPHRSDDQLRHIAGVRGIQANCEYAEAFEILRWVE